MCSNAIQTKMSLIVFITNMPNSPRGINHSLSFHEPANRAIDPVKTTMAGIARQWS
jgi:hypothetical protein